MLSSMKSSSCRGCGVGTGSDAAAIMLATVVAIIPLLSPSITLCCLAALSIGEGWLTYCTITSMSSSITCSVVAIVDGGGKASLSRFLSRGGRLVFVEKKISWSALQGSGCEIGSRRFLSFSCSCGSSLSS